MPNIDAYTMYKSMWPRPDVSAIAKAFSVKPVTVYTWIKKPIQINNVKYPNWKAAIAGETKELRDAYENEINEQIKEGYKLSECWANEVMKKALIKVKDPEYVPTLDEIKLAILIHEKQKGNLSIDSGEIDAANQKLNFNITFRGDKVGDIVES